MSELLGAALREGGDKYGAHWDRQYSRRLSDYMSVRATEDALLLQRLLKAVNEIQEEVWHSCSGRKRPITVHYSKQPVNSTSTSG
jgi:hypothetical protein